jgi:hypothetical protein
VVDWELIPKVLNARNVDFEAEVSAADRRLMKINKADYHDALIIPCYRRKYHEQQVVSQADYMSSLGGILKCIHTVYCKTTNCLDCGYQQMYCVVNVDESKTPLSEFDDPETYRTFKDYVEDKYELIVVNTTQPMLIVKPVSKQLNLLVTKFNPSLVYFLIDAKYSSTIFKSIGWRLLNFTCNNVINYQVSREERKDAKYSSSVIKVIPELCRVHPLPSSLYLQAKMLPSILHRTYRLLLAEEIRHSVASLFKLPSLDADLSVENDKCAKLHPRLK